MDSRWSFSCSASTTPSTPRRLPTKLRSSPRSPDGLWWPCGIPHAKPAPGLFETTRKAGAVDPVRLAVGDIIQDIRGARAPGIGCICVETGGFSQPELSEVGASHVYRDVKELSSQLYTCPLATLLR